MKLSLTTIEDAIITALRGDPTLTAYCKVIVSFQQKWENARKAGRVLAYPAVGVAYIGGEDAPAGMLRFRHTGRWAVVVSAKNLRKATLGAKGASELGEVGAYQMMVDVRDVLAGNACGVDGLRELFPISAEPLELNPEDLIAEYQLVFETSWIWSRDDEAVETASVEATYLLEDGDTVLATDTILIPSES